MRMDKCDPPIIIKPESTKPHHPRFGDVPRLVFENHAPHFRHLVLCKWQCPNEAPMPRNICLITANPNHLGGQADLLEDQAGWLSFTNDGVKYMNALGVAFPSDSNGWRRCPDYRTGRRELGNLTKSPATSYEIGCFFETPERALKWLINLFKLLRRPVCQCTKTDVWPKGLVEILSNPQVAQC